MGGQVLEGRTLLGHVGHQSAYLVAFSDEVGFEIGQVGRGPISFLLIANLLTGEDFNFIRRSEIFGA